MHKKNSKQFRQSLFFLFVACLMGIFYYGCGEKDTGKKVYHVGILSGFDHFFDIAKGFQAKMTELGYIEGANIEYDVQKTHADTVGEERVVKKFVKDQVDLIFTFPPETTFSVKRGTRGTAIPMVFAMTGIEGNDLVESIRHPGGNMTGVRYPIMENIAKPLEILLGLEPKPKRVWVTYDPLYPNMPSAIEQLRKTAIAFGITLLEDPVYHVEDIETMLQKRAAGTGRRIDVMLLLPEHFSQSPEGFGAILAFANAHGIPVGGDSPYTVELGALFSLVPDFFEAGALAAPLADKVFKGVPAGTIPIVTPENRLYINYKVARKLNLKVSESLLRRADKIIQ